VSGIQASSAFVAEGSEESSTLLEACSMVTLRIHPARGFQRGLSRTQRRRRQRERRVKASFKVNNSTTVAQHRVVTTPASVEFGRSTGVSNATPDLEEWHVRTDLGGMVVADLLPDLS